MSSQAVSPVGVPAPTPVWFGSGKTILSEVVVAELDVVEDRIRIRSRGTVSAAAAERVEKSAKRPGLAARLTREPEVTVLDAPRASVEATFPSFGSMLRLRVGEAKFSLAFHPGAFSGDMIGAWTSIFAGRRVNKSWREYLKT